MCIWVYETSHPCAFVLFSGTLKDIKQKWPLLGEDEKKKYFEEAAALRAEAKNQILSPEMRELKIKKHLKSLKLEV